MTKQSFEKIILNLQAARKRSHELYKLGVDLMDYDERYEHVIDEFFQATFNPDQLGWIDWYLSERVNFSGKIKKAWKKVGRKKVEICHTIDSLWETINEYGQDQAFNDRVGG
jgi:hypothetical protein